MKSCALVLIKPDAMSKGLVGEVMSKLNQTGLSLEAAKLVAVDKTLAADHYENIKGTPFYKGVIDFLTGKLHDNHKVLVLIYKGPQAIKKLRDMAGATSPEDAAPGTIRGSYGRITTKRLYENVVHVSSSPEEATREIKLWFEPSELPATLVPKKAVKEVQQTKAVWA